MNNKGRFYASLLIMMIFVGELNSLYNISYEYNNKMILSSSSDNTIEKKNNSIGYWPGVPSPSEKYNPGMILVANDVLVFGKEGISLYSPSGALIWKRSTPGPVVKAFYVSNRIIICLDLLNMKNIWLINPEDGMYITSFGVLDSFSSGSSYEQRYAIPYNAILVLNENQTPLIIYSSFNDLIILNISDADHYRRIRIKGFLKNLDNTIDSPFTFNRQVDETFLVSDSINNTDIITYYSDRTMGAFSLKESKFLWLKSNFLIEPTMVFSITLNNIRYLLCHNGSSYMILNIRTGDLIYEFAFPSKNNNYIDLDNNDILFYQENSTHLNIDHYRITESFTEQISTIRFQLPTNVFATPSFYLSKKENGCVLMSKPYTYSSNFTSEIILIKMVGSNLNSITLKIPNLSFLPTNYDSTLNEQISFLETDSHYIFRLPNYHLLFVNKLNNECISMDFQYPQENSPIEDLNKFNFYIRSQSSSNDTDSYVYTYYSNEWDDLSQEIVCLNKSGSKIWRLHNYDKMNFTGWRQLKQLKDINSDGFQDFAVIYEQVDKEFVFESIRDTNGINALIQIISGKDGTIIQNYSIFRSLGYLSDYSLNIQEIIVYSYNGDYGLLLIPKTKTYNFQNITSEYLFFLNLETMAFSVKILSREHSSTTFPFEFHVIPFPNQENSNETNFLFVGKTNSNDLRYNRYVAIRDLELNKNCSFSVPFSGQLSNMSVQSLWSLSESNNNTISILSPQPSTSIKRTPDISLGKSKPTLEHLDLFSLVEFLEFKEGIRVQTFYLKNASIIVNTTIPRIYTTNQIYFSKQFPLYLYPTDYTNDSFSDILYIVGEEGGFQQFEVFDVINNRKIPLNISRMLFYDGFPRYGITIDKEDYSISMLSKQQNMKFTTFKAEISNNIFNEIKPARELIPKDLQNIYSVYELSDFPTSWTYSNYLAFSGTKNLFVYNSSSDSIELIIYQEQESEQERINRGAICLINDTFLIFNEGKSMNIIKKRTIGTQLDESLISIRNDRIYLSESLFTSDTSSYFVYINGILISTICAPSEIRLNKEKNELLIVVYFGDVYGMWALQCINIFYIPIIKLTGFTIIGLIVMILLYSLKKKRILV